MGLAHSLCPDWHAIRQYSGRARTTEIQVVPTADERVLNIGRSLLVGRCCTIRSP